MNTSPADNQVALGPITKRKRKMLVVIDNSPESRVALRFASGRAAHVEGGEVHLFHVIQTETFQHWIAVEDAMRAEAMDAAVEMMSSVARRVRLYCGLTPETHIVEGDPKDEILKFIRNDPDMFLLVLGAGEGDEPGPLVDYFSGPLAASLTCPLVVVPGTLTREQVDDMV